MSQKSALPDIKSAVMLHMWTTPLRYSDNELNTGQHVRHYNINVKITLTQVTKVLFSSALCSWTWSTWYPFNIKDFTNLQYF